MSVEEEETTGENTDFKVFVSRIPSSWNNRLMLEHFISLGFGDVASAEIFTTKSKQNKRNSKMCYAFKNTGVCEKGDDCIFSHASEEPSEENLGVGCVNFCTEDGMKAALDQASLHLSRRVVKISPFNSIEDGRDTVICYAWKKGNCKHGDNCKFSHEGDGGCEKVGEPYKGRRFQCMSFKSKGKCSKGDNCQFLHVKKDKKESINSKSNDSEDNNAEEKKKGICHSFKKKGKCRKGDSCVFSHELSSKRKDIKIDLVDEQNQKKRRRVDGSVLVELRKQNSDILLKKLQ